MPSSTSSPASSSDVATAGLLVRGLTGPADGPIIHDIDITVPARTTLVVLGPIQSGKTMVMRHLVGLEQAERGTIELDGVRLDAAAPTRDALHRLRLRIGAIFEGSALLRHISVLGNVELPMVEHTQVRASEAREAARELLAEVGMRVEDDTMPAELGRAEQRRVALARALALRPAVLLLDEPTTGLDAHAAHEFDELLEGIQARFAVGVVIFTHEVRYAFGRPTEIDVMAGGRVVARGRREALLGSTDPLVRRLFHRRERE